MSISPQDILNLSENYDLNDIKRSFYALSRQYHPDSPNCNFLTKEEKTEMFIVFEKAYKDLIENFVPKEFDAPMYSKVEYEDDCYVEKNNSLTNIHKFNEEFEKIHSEVNKDNPWSIYYVNQDNTSNKFKLDFLRPDDHKTKYYFEYGVNNCSDFTRPGEFTDIYHEDENLDNIELHYTDLESLLKSRENIEYSEEINQQEKKKRDFLQKIENDRRTVQMERDFKLLSLRKNNAQEDNSQGY